MDKAAIAEQGQDLCLWATGVWVGPKVLSVVFPIRPKALMGWMVLRPD